MPVVWRASQRASIARCMRSSRVPEPGMRARSASYGRVFIGGGGGRPGVRLQRGRGVWEQAEEAGPLDGLGDHLLLAGAGLEALAPVDLAVGAHHAPEVLD